MRRHGKHRFDLADDSGAVAIVVAFLLLTLLAMTAFVVDWGGVYQVRRQMVTAADAAALAGAQELHDVIFVDDYEPPPGVTPESWGRSIAVTNESDPALTQVIVVGRTVTAETGTTYDYTIGRAIGLEQDVVGARAEAVVGAVAAMKGLLPIAFKEEVYLSAEPDDEVGLLSFQDLGPGNWGMLSFAGTGGTFYNPNNLANILLTGWGEEVSLADPDVYTNTGQAVTKNKAVEDALESLEGQVVYVPIVRGALDTKGSEWIEVIGFAAIRIDEFTPAKGNVSATISATFLHDVVPGGYVDPNAPFFGLSTWGLIR